MGGRKRSSLEKKWVKGSRKAVLCFWDGSGDFGVSTLPVCLQTQTPGK